MGFRKSVLIASASVLAVLGMVSPALAQSGAPTASEEEEIIVTGIRGSLRQSIETKREADTVVDVLSAEDVGQFPDRNVAEAVQRLPGVQINREFGEGERVSVRGLAPNLTRTLLNGHALATADWFILDQQAATRSFNYLMLPSEIISQVQVHKSPSADLEEGGVGGTVDVRTRTPLQLDAMTVNLSAEGAYSELSESTDPQVSGLFSWKNEAETFGFLIAGVYQERNLRRDGVEVLGYFPFNHDGDPNTPTIDAPALIGSSLFLQERIREGVNFAAQFRPNDRWDVNVSGLYSKLSADNLNQNFMAWGSNALGGGSTLTNFVIENGTAVAGDVSLQPLPDYDGADNIFVDDPNTPINEAADNKSRARGVVFDAIDRIAHAQTRNIDFDTTYSPSDDLKLHFQVGYTDAEGNTDAQPFVEFSGVTGFSFDLRGGVPRVTYHHIDPNDPDTMGDPDSPDPFDQRGFDFGSMHEITNDDSEFYAYFDVSKDVDLGALTQIQAGVKYTDHERDVGFMATTFGGFFGPMRATACGGPCSPADFFGGVTPSDYLADVAVDGTLDSYWVVNRGEVERILQGFPSVEASRVLLPSENFSIQEKVLGGYMLGRFGGDDWRGNVGVRVVQTDQTSRGNTVFNENPPPDAIPNPFGAFIPVTVDRSYTDVLPSANFAFDLTDDLVLRFAAARTMARPDYTDIAPRFSLNVGALTGSAGNPNVDPFRANQFDVSVEYYLSNNSVFAAALFYKDIQSFITSRSTTAVFPVETTTPNLSRCTAAGGPNQFNCVFFIDERVNGGGGRVQGFELNAQTPIWSDFGVIANYTYSDAETQIGDPLPGNSEHTFNITGYYETDLLSARLSWTQRSEFFVAFDRASPLNQDGVKSLDASVNFNVTDNLALTFDAINLTDENIFQFAGFENKARAVYDNGIQYYFGARFRH